MSNPYLYNFAVIFLTLLIPSAGAFAIGVKCGRELERYKKPRGNQ